MRTRTLWHTTINLVRPKPTRQMESGCRICLARPHQNGCLNLKKSLILVQTKKMKRMTHWSNRECWLGVDCGLDERARIEFGVWCLGRGVQNQEFGVWRIGAQCVPEPCGTHSEAIEPKTSRQMQSGLVLQLDWQNVSIKLFQKVNSAITSSTNCLLLLIKTIN